MAKKVTADLPIEEVSKNSFEDIDKLIAKEFDQLVDMSKVDTKVKTWFDTGVYALNYGCSKNLFGGIPLGRVTAIDGLASTGKSLIAASIMKDPKIDYVLLIESEGGGSSEELLQFAGVDLRKVRIQKFKTFGNYKINKGNSEVVELKDSEFPKKKEDEKWIYEEGLIRFMKRFINAIRFNNVKKNILIVLDSLGNMMSVRELTGSKDMGARNIDIGSFFRNFDVDFEKTNMSFIFCNKLYTNIGNQWEPYKASGGVPVEYNPSLGIRLTITSETDDVTEAEMKTERDRRATALGSSLKTIRAKISKSRFGTEFRNITFLIDFAVGPARYSGLFGLCYAFGIMERSGAMYSIEGVFEKSFYKKDFINLVREDEKNVLEKLQKKLEEAEKKLLESKKQIEVKDIEVEIDDEEEERSLDTAEMLKEMTKDVEKSG
jgi:RecA/RadA recombinase